MVHQIDQTEYESSEIAVHSEDIVNTEHNSDRGQIIKLLSQLQTTLDVDKVIGLFSEVSAKRVPFDGLVYSNPVQDIEIKVGQQAPHTCSYRLVMADDSLGRLSFMRSHEFSGEEIHELENQLVCLMYPLRNALMYQRALQSALKDPLTGLYNRAAMDAAMHREIRLARRNKAPLSLLVLDIDYFKKINDTYGHAAGDGMLKGLSECVANCIRTTDIFSRFGGEEFSVLLNGTDQAGAQLLAERICQAVRETKFAFKKLNLDLSLSIGVATLQTDDDDKSFFVRADEALYQAKRSGRDKVCVAT